METGLTRWRIPQLTQQLFMTAMRAGIIRTGPGLFTFEIRPIAIAILRLVFLYSLGCQVTPCAWRLLRCTVNTPMVPGSPLACQPRLPRMHASELASATRLNKLPSTTPFTADSGLCSGPAVADCKGQPCFARHSDGLPTELPPGWPCRHPPSARYLPLTRRTRAAPRRAD